MLSVTVRSTLAQLDEVRLALHILPEAKFGELNENQEELLGTARRSECDGRRSPSTRPGGGRRPRRAPSAARADARR
jgi:hypothetical protein